MLPGDWETRIDGAAPGSVAAFFHRVLHHGSGTIEHRLRAPRAASPGSSERARVAVRLSDGSAEVVGTIADVTTERESLAAQAAMTFETIGAGGDGLRHGARVLNQPLTSISLSAERAELALQGIPIDRQTIARTLLKSSRGRALRAGEIVDQLRRFGRADQGPPGPVRLEVALQGALALAAGPLRDASITPRIDVAADLPPVLGRQVPIEQVFLNLCMNARDAMATRPAEARRLTITARAEGGHVRVGIADTGGGVPPAVMARLFDPFFTTKPAGSGTGLGLSICLRLMRRFRRRYHGAQHRGWRRSFPCCSARRRRRRWSVATTRNERVAGHRRQHRRQRRRGERRQHRV